MKKITDNSERLTLTFPNRLRAELAELAARLDTTISALIREACWQLLENQKEKDDGKS